ncbi:MAG: hypothetical protein IPK26_31765 [Planctomycetes bacterium]|nr:hypothetical protein [Planctomycetota bacterium]
MRAATWLLTGLSLAVVLGVLAWELQPARSGPGPLHPAHAAAIGPQGTCERCHVRGAGISAESCTECHRPIAAQMAANRGLHGAMPRDLASACASCHPEHHGAATRLLSEHAFTRAGITVRTEYDHRHVAGFALGGAHTRLECAQCHQQAESPAPPSGGRWLGLQQTCANCHDDVHRGAYGSDCAHCHGQEQPFANAPGFRHDRFPLRQAHANRRCDQCHPATGDHAIAALQQHQGPVRACVDCHADPHEPRIATANGRLPIRAAADCARCHTTESFPAHTITSANHHHFGPGLTGPHAAVDCLDCHGTGTQPNRWTGDAPVSTDCGRCHASPHRATLMAGPADAACGECHSDTHQRFADATVAATAHARIGFALTPPHDRAACATCHPREKRLWNARYPGRTAAACSGCHADPHGAQFATTPAFAECTACHEPTRFSPPAFDATAHATASFPLRDAHTAVACRRCHDRVIDGIRRFDGTKTRCADCHRDPHGGRFDGAAHPTAIAGRTDCARCHDERAFAPVAVDFDHARWTGFALRDAHAALACNRCHERLDQPDATGRRFGKALGSKCADCHQDVHAGQFAVAGTTDCARCHQQTRFADLTFDHQRHSRFALDDAHRRLACASCHPSVATGAGPVTRYRPLGTTCADCHAAVPKDRRR